MRGELVAGIDLGCASTKCVLLDEAGAVRGSGTTRTLPGFEAVARAALEAALAAAGAARGDVVYVATSGLGRASVPWRQIQMTDVTAAARGAHALFPEARFVLDMGAQTTRAIRLRDGGKVGDFHMNEKCAAGSGGFVERAARYLDVPIAEVGLLSLRAREAQPISSICAVLAESEIINHVSEGRSVEDILRGIHASLADRAKAQLRRVGLAGGGPGPRGGRLPIAEEGPPAPVAFVGGVALQAGMVEAFRAALGVPVLVTERPDLATALGAAILGWQRVRKARAAAAAS
jgi:predicted CoA-substrate-specific enzyme activase